MKKLFLILFLFVGAYSHQSFAGEPVDITMEIVKEGSESNGNPRGPVNTIIVTLEDNVLTLPIGLDGFLLQVIAENGFVAYSTVVSGNTQIVLPNTLSGNYELRFVTNTYYYYGYIEL